MRGFTYYTENLSKEKIKSFCLRLKKRFEDSPRVLKIHIFNNKTYTPDVTLKYYIPKSSEKYLIADYWYNPFNNKSNFNFYKKIK